jgi:hypothetical protein
MASFTEWFDQFTLEWSEPWPEGSQWCPRHWAPCPLLGSNGIGAVTELFRLFVGTQPANSTVDEMNAALDQASPVCCTLGDEAMYELWQHWPPVDGDRDIRTEVT